MTIQFYRNRGAVTPRRFGIAHLPVRQTLIWVGPLFIRVAPRNAA